MLRMTCTAVIMAQRRLLPSRHRYSALAFSAHALVSLCRLRWLVGCFVPAARARIAPVDAIYSRMGANDLIFANASTFKVEMDDCNKILTKVCDPLPSEAVRSLHNIIRRTIGDSSLACDSRRARTWNVDVRRHGDCVLRPASTRYACRLRWILRNSLHLADGGLCRESAPRFLQYTELSV